MVKLNSLSWLILILCLGLTFRVINLSTLPFWDWDEGVNQNAAWNLSEGRAQWFALKYAWVPHPPAYFMASALLIRVFGNSLYYMRLLSVAYSILTSAVIYFIGAKMFDAKTGLLAALLYSACPATVYWGRMAFANNQVVFLATLSMYFVYAYIKERKSIWLYLTCLTTGLTTMTEYSGLASVMAITALIWVYDRKRTPSVLVASMGFMAVFVAYMLAVAPNEFTFDVSHQLSRFNILQLAILGGVFLVILYFIWRKITFFYRPIGLALVEDLPLYLMFMSPLVFFRDSPDHFMDGTNFIFILGLIGLLFIPSYSIEKKLERHVITSFLLAYLLVLVGLDRADHITILVYPYFTLGLSVLIQNAYLRLINQGGLLGMLKIRVPAWAAVTLIFYPIPVLLYQDASIFVWGEDIQRHPVEDVMRVAEYINANTVEDDVILAYSYFTPFIKAKMGVLVQAVAYTQTPIAYYPGDLPPERFSFNTSIENARYIVAAGEVFGWLHNQTRLGEIIEASGWPATEFGLYKVYENPKNGI